MILYIRLFGNFLPSFQEAKSCGVPSCVIEKSVCTANKKTSLQNTGLETNRRSALARRFSSQCDIIKLPKLSFRRETWYAIRNLTKIPFYILTF